MSGNRGRKPKKIAQATKKKQKEILQENSTVEDKSVTVGSKRKRKIEDEVAPKKIKREQKDKTVKKKKKKIVEEETAENGEQETKEFDVVEQNNDEKYDNNNETTEISIKDENLERSTEQITWSSEEQVELLTRIENLVPEHDTLAYSTRAEKLDWNKVAFNNYTGEDCKKVWMFLQKKVRKFRLLSEVLNDAKEWVLNPKSKNTTGKKTLKHPDMPRRPPSSYLLFCSDKRDEVVRENPGVETTTIAKILGETFRNLPIEEKEVYREAAARGRAKYHENLHDFYEQHPEMKTSKIKEEKSVNAERNQTDRVKVKLRKKNEKQKKERPPKRCLTAFGLFYESELSERNDIDDKQAFKEKCKEIYKALPDKMKLPWILKAEEEFNKYKEEIRIYNEKHPDHPVQALKSILTKDENDIKKTSTGEPLKPPNSAYNLFSKTMLQSEEIKSVNPKDRLIHIANSWKNLDEDAKQPYRDQYFQLVEKYKSDFNSYLERLPEEERALLTKPNKKSRKTNKTKDPEIEPQNHTEETIQVKEPVQPPISPYKYFASIYEGNDDPLIVWKSLSSEEKRKYDRKLIEIKEDYLIEFENFLKSLSQDALETFCKSRPSSRSAESSECSTDVECDHDDGYGDAIIEGDNCQNSISCDSM